MITTILGFVAEIAKPLFGIIDKAVPDKAEANRLKAELQAGMQELATKVMEHQATLIENEQKSQDWLPRNIRPLFLLALMVFIGVSLIMGAAGKGSLIAAGWDSVPSGAWTLAQICLGGYITGRSLEKIAGAANVGAAMKDILPRWQRDKDYLKSGDGS